jgi:hypothetical protein
MSQEMDDMNGTPQYQEKPPVREIFPFYLDKVGDPDDDAYNFRPTVLPADAVEDEEVELEAPKDSPVIPPVESSVSTNPDETQPDLSEVSKEAAGSTQPVKKTSKTGQQTS